MSGTGSSRRSRAHAALACAALILAAACSEHGRSTPTAPSSPPASRSSVAQPVDTRTDLGDFAMTLTASPSCTLPDPAMSGTYQAHLKEGNGRLYVEFEDQRFVCGFWGCGFTGRREDDRVRFTLTSWTPGATDFAFIYQLTGDTDLGYVGTSVGALDERGFSAVFEGAIVLYVGSTNRESARCDARDHRLQLTRM